MKELPKLVLESATYLENDPTGYPELEVWINGKQEYLADPKRFLLQNRIVFIGDAFDDYVCEIDGVELRCCTDDETIYQLVMNWLEACNSDDYRSGEVDMETLQLKKA